VLTSPEHFDVQYVINPHMSGNIGGVDRPSALQQWKALRATYSALDVDPLIVDGQPGLPDMVFCANQTLPYHDPRTGTDGVVLSRMHALERQDEVPHYDAFFKSLDYAVESLPDTLNADFEGMGDAIWHPGRFLLWGGYGFRTGRATYEALADLLDVRIIALSLTDPEFYHLDTCFSVLDEQSVLIYPGAFNDEALDLIHAFFDTVVEAPDSEARHQFACNAHCPDRRHVLIQEGCTVTMERLRGAGFRPVELDTSEFLKSGGSVFCMKQMIW
jgi:N-dimethylarginine dimethylaminohydrolase